MKVALTSPRSGLTRTEMRTIPHEVQDLAAELQRVIDGEVRFDGYTRMLYSTDASLYQIQPVGVVIPKHADDAQAALELARRHQVPVLPRGGGSSLAGQTVGAALVLDFSKYMDQLITVDVESRTATAQPGITVARLNGLLARHGLMLGPDPASADRATIGGSVANNATGSHSILYGMMADNVLEMSVLLADGSRAHFGPLDPGDLPAKARTGGLEGRIYDTIPLILQGVMEELVERWPKHWRRASGYNLDRLAASLLPPDQRARLSFDSRFRPEVCNPTRIDRFNLAQLVTGSEGTLAIMTDVTLQLVPRPRRTALAVVHFQHLLDACAAIPDILETEPSASELLDKQLMDLARAQPEWAKKLHFVEGDPPAVLLTEYYGEDERELVQKLERLEGLLYARGWRSTVVRILDPARIADVWSVRKAGLNLLMSRRGPYKPVPGIEDVSVPPERLADYLGEILAFCRQQEDIPDVAVYAHASAGCLHVRPLINPKSAQGVEMLARVGRRAAELAVQYHGAMSGEHGDGLARSAYNPTIFGPTLYAALQEVKRTFDPDNLLNPGKIVDAPPPTEHLRFGPEYRTISLDTVFDWGADGGYAPAIEMCNGAGVCRKLGAGTMCPSYMATKDERDTTRGRANALRNALAGRIPHEELFTPEMKGVMDLCLGCKACKSECPSAVDMARIKAEYLVHYHRHNGLPLFNRLMGWLPTLNALLYRLAPGLVPAVNWSLRTPPAKAALARIGIHPQRDLPAYAPQTFERWFHQRARSDGSGQRPNGPVILFHDTWVNYNEPHIGQAMVRVLEAAGYQVYLAAGRKCCGRPLITGGQADKARPWVDHNVALLAPYAQQGIPIIGVEPSCILTLRDEYLALASDSQRAQVLAQGAFTFEEFVVREVEAGRFKPMWRSGGARVLLHGHCHQKALVGNEASVAALQAAGYQVEVIPSGCCGMAGDFGYETEHYEISRRIGEDRLLPAVRQADPEALIVASGTSCRHQIEHFAGRQPVHLAEALAAALAD
ncbi:FAD-binding protein [Litorilinea aerophila]|uniref:FAD-binding protein n=1 Tax=Litorilinea aerophila TaxID=1204385 RepID=A0A540VHM6_9CHLR|nr:FAD-binding and (Fe-S)-binding domain-containing protein [Litorilinea aerophila]MCC9076252.1 FAD-binding protein [Litorilinea aerophila]